MSLHNLVVCSTGISLIFVQVCDAQSRLKWATCTASCSKIFHIRFVLCRESAKNALRASTSRGGLQSGDRCWIGPVNHPHLTAASAIIVPCHDLVPSHSGDFRSEIQSYLRCATAFWSFEDALNSRYTLCGVGVIMQFYCPCKQGLSTR